MLECPFVFLASPFNTTLGGLFKLLSSPFCASRYKSQSPLLVIGHFLISSYFAILGTCTWKFIHWLSTRGSSFLRVNLDSLLRSMLPTLLLRPLKDISRILRSWCWLLTIWHFQQMGRIPSPRWWTWKASDCLPFTPCPLLWPRSLGSFTRPWSFKAIICPYHFFLHLKSLTSTRLSTFSFSKWA